MFKDFEFLSVKNEVKWSVEAAGSAIMSDLGTATTACILVFLNYISVIHDSPIHGSSLWKKPHHNQDFHTIIMTEVK